MEKFDKSKKYTNEAYKIKLINEQIFYPCLKTEKGFTLLSDNSFIEEEKVTEIESINLYNLYYGA